MPIALLLFAGSAVWADYDVLLEKEPNLACREIADRLRSAGLDGRFATNTANRDRAACTAFFLNQKFIALPNERDAITLQSKLDARGIRFLYRWSDADYGLSYDWPEPQLRSLLATKKWSKAIGFRLDTKRRLDVYQRITSPSANCSYCQSCQ